VQVKSWNSCVEFNSSFFVFWGIPFGGFWSKKTWTNMNKLEKACINFLRLLIKSTSQAVDIFKISRTEIKPPILDIFFHFLDNFFHFFSRQIRMRACLEYFCYAWLYWSQLRSAVQEKLHNFEKLWICSEIEFLGFGIFAKN